MYANDNAPQESQTPSGRHFAGAPVLYYLQGPPIAKAFAHVELGLIDRYYRWRKEHPDGIGRR